MIKICYLTRCAAVTCKVLGGKFINYLFIYKRKLCFSAGNYSRSFTPWKVIFYGNDRFSLESLKILNENRVGSDDSAKVVKELEVVTSMTKSPVRDYAVASRIPIHNWPYTVPSNKFDIGVVVSFGHMIMSKSIDACTYGMLNAHASLLPRWRGAAPLVHTILNGDKITGITILQVSPEKFDRGKILLQECFDVPSHFTSNDLSTFLAPAAARLVLQCLQDLPNLMKHSQPQAKDGATYAYKVTPAMGLIDWPSQTYDDIDRQYRALNNIVNVYTEWHGVQANLIDMADWSNPRSRKVHSYSYVFPGVCYFNKKLQALCIKCKDEWVGFKNIKLVGKKQMTAQDFHNGYLSKMPTTQCYFGKKTHI